MTLSNDKDLMNTLLINRDAIKLNCDQTFFFVFQKKFVKGLRQFGKNFYKIHKELLVHKKTVSKFYYYGVFGVTESLESHGL